MRIFKNNSIFLILILILSISMSACSSKAPKIEEPTVLVEEKNQEPEIQIKEQEKEEDLIEDIIEDEEELNIEEDKTVEEEIDIVEKDKEEPVVEPEQAIIEKEPEKTTTADEPAEAPEKEEIVEEVKNAIKIKGNVGKESSFTLAELKNMTDIIFEDDFYSLNNFGTTNHTLFKGVNLWKLLQKVDISSSATKVKIIATDGYEVEFTIAQVKRQDYIDESNLDKVFPMIIAWEEKGKEFDSSDAPPYKLIVGQSEPGDVNKPQWVSKIDRIIVE